MIAALAAVPAGAVICGCHALAGLDSALCRASVYRSGRARALASIFGPEQSFEYTGTTTPSVAP